MKNKKIDLSKPLMIKNERIVNIPDEKTPKMIKGAMEKGNLKSVTLSPKILIRCKNCNMPMKFSKKYWSHKDEQGLWKGCSNPQPKEGLWNNINKIMLQHKQDNIKPMTDEEIAKITLKDIEANWNHTTQIGYSEQAMISAIRTAIQLTRQSERKEKCMIAESGYGAGKVAGKLEADKIWQEKIEKALDKKYIVLDDNWAYWDLRQKIRELQEGNKNQEEK